jgi:DNA-binding transcriptional MerR regulator
MRIGELASHAGTTTRALRYYESQGLIRSRRSANGYREYDDGDLRMVREILSLQAVGFALEETRPFIECLRAGHETGDSCPDSIAVYRRKLSEVDACIDRMGSVRKELAAKLAEASTRRCGRCRSHGGDGSPSGTCPEHMRRTTVSTT